MVVRERWAMALVLVVSAVGCDCGGGVDELDDGGRASPRDGGVLSDDGGQGWSSADGGASTARDGGLPDETCRRLDLIFAVDDSNSMSQEQGAMRDTVFPAFARKLQERLPQLEDFRAAVIDACPLPGTFHTRGESGDCHFQSGKRWIESSSTNLVEEFSCAGSIDAQDSTCAGQDDDEQPASSAAASMEPPAYGPGGPNEGFLRADALLVVVAITDEDERPVPGATAQQVYQRILKAKASDVRRVVFLGIGGAGYCLGEYGLTAEATMLKELTGLFAAQNRGVFWDLCSGHLEDGLDQTLTLIKTACDDLPSPTCPAGSRACPNGAGDCETTEYCASGCCVAGIN
ncbi:MAG: hypothetical protein HY901_17640 [Deltaproteobacteria bacterium]|nr:hypothetical protein [Deltaproteobacteria bacterium]